LIVWLYGTFESIRGILILPSKVKGVAPVENPQKRR